MKALHVEVIYMVDPTDEHVMKQMKEYDGKKLLRATEMEELESEFEPLEEDDRQHGFYRFS